jgi:uncharacterized protein (PEP-CTERM system associated)
MNIKTEFLLPAMLLFSTNSQAFDWLFQPDFDANERYTDNLRMQINPTRDNFITTLSPSLLAGFIDSNQELRTSFRWNEIIYHDDPDMDDFGEKIADFSHQFSGENFKTDLKAQYAYQSSLNTQLDQDGSGNLQLQIPRHTISVSPGVTYNFTEKNALQLGYNYLDVWYDRIPGQLGAFNYSDYQNHQVSASAIHSYSERLSLNVTGIYSHYTSPTDFSTSGAILYCNDLKAPNVNTGLCSDGSLPVPSLISTSTGYKQISDNFTYQGGFQYIFDEQTQLSASAGMRNTDTTTEINSNSTFDPINSNKSLPDFLASQNLSSNGIGYVYSANLNRKSDWGGLSLNADQQINPSSNGTQQQSTSFYGNINYNISERWITGLNARYQLTESTTTSNDISQRNNRTYTTVTPNIRWSWTPEINLNLSYSYRYQKFDNLDDPSIGNNLELQFSYQPQINRLVK